MSKKYIYIFQRRVRRPPVFFSFLRGGNPSTLSGSIRAQLRPLKRGGWGRERERDQLCKVVRDFLWSHKMPTAGHGNGNAHTTTTSRPSMSFLLYFDGFLACSLSLPLFSSFFHFSFQDEMTASVYFQTVEKKKKNKKLWKTRPLV